MQGKDLVFSSMYGLLSEIMILDLGNLDGVIRIII